MTLFKVLLLSFFSVLLLPQTLCALYGKRPKAF
jgi:hypothetical protein